MAGLYAALAERLTGSECALPTFIDGLCVHRLLGRAVAGRAAARPRPSGAPPRTENANRDRVSTDERGRGTGLVGQLLDGAMAQLSPVLGTMH